MILRQLTIILFTLLLTGGVLSTSNGAVKVIWDTDLGDADDAGACAVMHALANRGEVEILACMYCSIGGWGGACLDAFNTYYGRPNIPIGACKDPGPNLIVYTYTIAQEFTQNIGQTVPDAKRLYRQVLASQPDSSVVIVVTGMLTNLKYLLATTSDVFSTLSGIDLVKKKVKCLVVMGGDYPAPNSFEWNFKCDGSAAQAVATNWPTPIVWSGGSCGGDIVNGAQLFTKTLTTNPIRRAYYLWSGANTPRPSWDITAIYYGIRGSQDLFNLSAYGYNQVTSDGHNTWSTTVNKGHRYLIKAKQASLIAPVFEALMIEPPMSTAISNIDFSVKNSNVVLNSSREIVFQNSTDYAFSIFSMNGELRNTINGHGRNVDLGSLTPGNYIIKGTTGEGKFILPINTR
jgi:inosine-uridine nucleoside N-ribohydrolase